MILFLRKLWFGLTENMIFYHEGAFQCPNLENTQCIDCDKCDGTGIVKMGFHSWKVAYGMEKYGYVLIWAKWNPLYKKKKDITK